MKRKTAWLFGVLAAGLAASLWAGETTGPAPPKGPSDVEVLAKGLTTPLKLLRGDLPVFTLSLKAEYGGLEGKTKPGGVALTLKNAQEFALSLQVEGMRAYLVREAGETRLVVPSKQVAIVGRGPLPAKSPLAPKALVSGILGISPKIGAYVGMMRAATPPGLALFVQQFGQMRRVPGKPGSDAPPTFAVGRLRSAGAVTLQVTADGASIGRISWTGASRKGTVAIEIAGEAKMPAAPTEGLKVVAVPRPELERALGRAVVRAAEILYNDYTVAWPNESEREADGGRLLIRKRYTMAILEGTPYQIGLQHGKLLAAGARRLCDSTLYVVGTYYTIEKGEWFLDVMRGAWKRLKPHIPADYLDEMRGLAQGVRDAGVPCTDEEVHLANVFPALFHCSGFAILPKATETGSLYHGRVLDYMVDVGLQHDAVLFVVKKQGAIPFANVGYAGFIGSVTGMNARQVCFGEMGGGGVGKWDGTPMPILMRMGLERAGTLQDAVRIFSKAKRTCEYYYVISDGKIPDAVGVRATPETIELVKPGQAHPLLPTPVEHCVVLSAGERYKALVARVKGRLGKFTAYQARRLMRRPVAMKSNLHNVLFLPAKYYVYVANARGRSPAYDEEFVHHRLKGLLAEPKAERPSPEKPKPAAR